MFGNLGMSEIAVIAVIALVVLGPEKFPEYAKIALRAYRDFRGYIDDIKKEMAEELRPVKDEIRELARHNPEEYVEDLAKAISAVDEPKKTVEVTSESSPYEDAAATQDTTTEGLSPAEVPSTPEAVAEAVDNAHEPAANHTPDHQESVSAKPAESPDRLDG